MRDLGGGQANEVFGGLRRQEIAVAAGRWRAIGYFRRQRLVAVGTGEQVERRLRQHGVLQLRRRGARGRKVTAVARGQSAVVAQPQRQSFHLTVAVQRVI